MSIMNFIKNIIFKKRKTISGKELSDIHYKHFSGRVCNICHEPYVGVAQDCKCTNYGE